MDSEQGPPIIAALQHRAKRGASAMEVVDAIGDAWREIETSLTPIIGPQGFAALFKRSLLLTGRAHPWLVESPQGMLEIADLAALKLVLVRQESEAIAAAGGEMLQTFYFLVKSLIGASLTRRLLRYVWETFD